MDARTKIKLIDLCKIINDNIALKVLYYAPYARIANADTKIYETKNNIEMVFANYLVYDVSYEPGYIVLTILTEEQLKKWKKKGELK